MFESLFADPMVGLHFINRWLHVFFGVVWIGHLYYFNFVQGAFMAETEPGAKSQVLQKLLPRALWWFRYGALGTFLTGVIMLSIRGHVDAAHSGMGVFASPYWVSILTGALLATIMFLNVWLVIWPKQQIVIANAIETAKGGAANPAAAGAAARALVASRTNTLLSIPMLWFMLSASHLGFTVSENASVSLYWIVVLLLTAAIEGNALMGKTGPMTTVKGVITSGFALTLVFVSLVSVLI